MRILDATCGGRMMWFDKDADDVVYLDRRIVPPTYIESNRQTFEVRPDVVANFTAMPFVDDTFDLVIFDPPHLPNAGEMSFMALKYGRLTPGWETEVADGFRECRRVLRPTGTLIVKWSEIRVPLSKMLAVIDARPLFGTRTRSETHWLTFRKTDAVSTC